MIRMLRLKPLLPILFAAFAAGVFAQDDVPLDPREADLLRPTQRTRRAPVLDQAATPIEDEPSERFRVLRGTMLPERQSEEELRLRALEGFLDYDDEEGIIYNPERTQIVYGKFFLEADRVIIDNRLQEVQAEGNVVFRVLDEEELQNEIFADSFRYNFGEGEGVAFGVKGRYGPVFFRTHQSEEAIAAQIPPFQQVSEQESIFRNTSITTCDFVIPHYRVRAREVILFQEDRIFFRGATFYVMDTPVLYLPFYTRSLTGGSPWFFQFGVGDDTGFRMRAGYEYEHETREPSFEDEDVYVTRTRGEARTYTDILTGRGIGAGFDYKYTVDYKRHRGEFSAYAMEDWEREVSEATLDDDSDEEEESERFNLQLRHRTEVTEHLSALVNVDWFSDPEVFYDVLDHFADSEFQRERQPERRARAAITYLREAYVARLLVEAKDRIGIDRYGDFSDPADNNFDFDLDPGVELDDSDVNSIARARWGRVSERLPEATFATRYLPFGRLPLYLTSEIRAYNNLDKGINTVDTDDDAWVRGLDVYHQLLWQYKITERYILLAKIGGGVGVADREEDTFGLDPINLRPFEDSIDLIDNDGTFRVGTEEFDYDDLEEFYAYGDAELRLNARFSDSLSGYVRWRIRETTDDFVGDFYARIGDYTSREDLFDYRLREHWVDGGLTYVLLHPSLVAFANGGANLVGHGDRFPNEELGYWNVGTRWANRRNTLKLGGSVGQSNRQVLHPSADGEGEQLFTFYRLFGDYSPIHGRWYTRAVLDQTSTSGDDDFEDDDADEFTFFTDEEDRTRVTLVYGRELGPKWDTEIKLRWDDRVEGLREIAWILQRDLHDAIASVKIRSKQSIEDADDRNDLERELDISFGLKLKLPEQDVSFGPGDVTTLRQRERAPVIAY